LRFVDFTRTAVHDAKTGRSDEHRSFANYWGDDDSCRVGENYQIPGAHRALRTWISPHRGRIRIEGNVHTDTGIGEGVSARIMHKDSEAWSSPVASPGVTGTHDITIEVEKSDAIDFVVEGPKGKKVMWDPVITYVDR
jgi:hypothetical protein